MEHINLTLNTHRHLKIPIKNKEAYV
jgi:hypothetical protein